MLGDQNTVVQNGRLEGEQDGTGTLEGNFHTVKAIHKRQKMIQNGHNKNEGESLSLYEKRE